MLWRYSRMDSTADRLPNTVMSEKLCSQSPRRILFQNLGTPMFLTHVDRTHLCLVEPEAHRIRLVQVRISFTSLREQTNDWAGRS